MNKLGFDVSTHAAKEVIGRLRKLKTTERVENMGQYHQDRSWTMVWIDTSWTEEELNDWLYKTKFTDSVDYGTFKREKDFE